MTIVSIVDNNLIEILKQSNLFERNKIPLEIKLTAIAMRIPQQLHRSKNQTSYSQKKNKETILK